MRVTNLPGELETKAMAGGGQRAGMLSRSWLRFVLMMTLNIATGPARAFNAPQVRPAQVGLITLAWSPFLALNGRSSRNRPMSGKRGKADAARRGRATSAYEPSGGKSGLLANRHVSCFASPEAKAFPRNGIDRHSFFIPNVRNSRPMTRESAPDGGGAASRA